MYGIKKTVSTLSYSTFASELSLTCLRLRWPLMANVVYQFTCLRDANSTYIGKTIRHLATRVKEHATSSSAIKEHLSSCTTCKNNYSCNSFKVIDSANSDFEVSIKEALHIKQYGNLNHAREYIIRANTCSLFDLYF